MNAMPISAAKFPTASLDYPIFKKAILNACKVVEKANTIPVLDTVLITAVAGGVQVLGTDLDLYTTTFVPGEVTPGFKCLVDAHKLKSTMDKVKDADRINFAIGEEKLTASIGKLNLNITQDLQIADFPDEEGFRTKVKASGCSFTLPSTTLEKALGKIAFAISSEETRYYLHGVFMHIDQYREKLSFATTDGHRLARYDMTIPAGAETMAQAGAIMPRKVVLELLRLVRRKDCKADIQIKVTNTGVSFQIAGGELLESKLIDGSFPDYGRTIPADTDKRAIAYVSDMVDAIKQASSISSERSKAIKLTISPNRMEFSCSNVDFGTACTEIKADTKDEITIGFNAGYLLEMLGNIEGAAEFKMSTHEAPAIITDTSDPDLTYVQMPMRV